MAAATGGVPDSDEALRSSMSRFRADPRGARPFVELAAALVARGHAAEALRVADHGLEAHPESVEGRTERAAALLALGLDPDAALLLAERSRGTPRIANRFLRRVRDLAQVGDGLRRVAVAGQEGLHVLDDEHVRRGHGAVGVAHRAVLVDDALGQ